MIDLLVLLALAVAAAALWWCRRRRGDCRWELGTSEDGSSFDLAILAIPVRGRLRRLMATTA